MKKILRLTIFLFLAYPILTSAQVPKRILMEEFTNASCPPCDIYNPGYNALVRANPTKVVPLNYHVWWPGFDPLYLQNTQEVRDRKDYYDIGSAPSGVVRGDAYQGHIANINQSMIDDLASVTTPLEIQITHDFVGQMDMLDIRVVVHNRDTATFSSTSPRIMVAITENEITYPEPPGNTNEKDFPWVMRKMLPDAFGTGMTENLAAGDSAVLTFTVPVPSYIFAYKEIAVVAFVQSIATKEVFQANFSEPIDVTTLPLYTDAGIESNTLGYDGLCDGEVTPAALIINEGTDTITSVEVEYTINGEDPVAETWTGELLPGEDFVFEMTPIVPSTGSLEFAYRLLDARGDVVDMDAWNNEAPTTDLISIMAPAIVYTEGTISEGFESTPSLEVPENMIFISEDPAHLAVMDRSKFSPLPLDVIGAYGKSHKSVVTFFYNMGKGKTAEFWFSKADLTGKSGTALTFDWSYTGRSPANNDKMEIQVSTDCGDTWTTVHTNAGQNMWTTQPTPIVFVPNRNLWKTDTLNLTQFDGMTDVNIRFKMTADNGNNLYIDNINLYQDPLLGTAEVIAAQYQFELFPNPARADFQIAFEMGDQAPVSLEVFNASGQLVEQLLLQETLPAGKHQFGWGNNAQPGVYLVKLTTPEGAVTRRVVLF